MEIVNFTPLISLAGGLLIGLSSVLLMFFNGKIAGISGISRAIIDKDCSNPHEKVWRIFFIFGLIAGGFLIVLLLPETTAKVGSFNSLQMILSGLLVGIGSSLGSGCTSGHGVCGLGRRSMRSLVAVVTFISTGFITVYFMFHIFKIGV